MVIFSLAKSTLALLFVMQQNSPAFPNPANRRIEDILQNMDLGNFGKAAAELKEFIQITGAKQAYFYLGYCQLSMAEYPQALESFQKAPRESWYSNRLDSGIGITYYHLSRLQEAEEKFERVLLQQPKNIDSLFFLGKVYQRQRQHRKAEKYFRKVLDQKPIHSGALFSLGQCLVRLGRTAEGRKVLKEHKKQVHLADRLKVLKRTVRGPHANAEDFWDLANAYLEQANYEGASQALERFVALRPDSPDASLFLAKLSISRKDYLGAETQLRQYLKNHPQSFSAWLLLGLAYRRIRDYSQASQAFERAREIDPKNPELRGAITEMQKQQTQEP